MQARGQGGVESIIPCQVNCQVSEVCRYGDVQVPVCLKVYSIVCVQTTGGYGHRHLNAYF
jgi:hypothetical protein